MRKEKKMRKKKKYKVVASGPGCVVVSGLTDEELTKEFKDDADFKQDPKTGQWNKVEFFLEKK